MPKKVNEKPKQLQTTRCKIIHAGAVSRRLPKARGLRPAGSVRGTARWALSHTGKWELQPGEQAWRRHAVGAYNTQSVRNQMSSESTREESARRQQQRRAGKARRARRTAELQPRPQANQSRAAQNKRRAAASRTAHQGGSYPPGQLVQLPGMGVPACADASRRLGGAAACRAAACRACCARCRRPSARRAGCAAPRAAAKAPRQLAARFELHATRLLASPVIVVALLCTRCVEEGGG